MLLAGPNRVFYTEFYLHAAVRELPASYCSDSNENFIPHCLTGSELAVNQWRCPTSHFHVLRRIRLLWVKSMISSVMFAECRRNVTLNKYFLVISMHRILLACFWFDLSPNVHSNHLSKFAIKADTSNEGNSMYEPYEKVLRIFIV